MVWNPGEQLFGGRYIIERKLGEGGIGITYLAKNERGQILASGSGHEVQYQNLATQLVLE